MNLAAEKRVFLSYEMSFLPFNKERLNMEVDEADKAGDDRPDQKGNQDLSQFIENMGLYYEAYDVPRIGGRILGLLMVKPNPMTSEEMSEILQVSRSSVSTNLRTLQMAGLVELVSVPGDRRDYYLFSEEAWLRILEMRLEQVLSMKEAAEEGLQNLKEEHPARQRIEEMLAWSEMVQGAYERLSSDWQSRREVPA
jgi:DNA-binding transcriptional regulator GbsR (MarR family)